MFEKPFEDRLAAWSDLRKELEDVEKPLQYLSDFYAKAPRVSIQTDPWSPDIWPSPWELVYENQYDDFCCVLGMCYSLQLTERFKESVFEIHINTDSNRGYVYMLYVDNFVLGYNDEILHSNSVPKHLESQHVYPMPPLQ